MRDVGLNLKKSMPRASMLLPSPQPGVTGVSLASLVFFFVLFFD